MNGRTFWNLLGVMEKKILKAWKNLKKNFVTGPTVVGRRPYRGETLTKTVRGMMYYRKALELQAFLDMAEYEGIRCSRCSNLANLVAFLEGSFPCCNKGIIQQML
ncbi:hypothetical protein Droror1_Dr00020127 [Drosera rotundifolia]